MCTVSIIPPDRRRGLRLVMNRDERRTRMAAWPPCQMTIDGVAVCGPTDSDGGGTWLMAADTGLVWAVTNIHPVGALMPQAATVSRGRIIPAMVSASSLSDATARFLNVSVERVAPFRLIVAGEGGLAILEWDGRHRSIRRDAHTGPRIFSTSSLGDSLVETAREQLFESLLVVEDDPWRAQDRLHTHAWPDRRHISVLMSRPTACTVSRTTVVASQTRAEVAYAPMIEGWPGPTTTAVLRFEQHVVAQPA